MCGKRVWCVVNISSFFDGAECDVDSMWNKGEVCE